MSWWDDLPRERQELAEGLLSERQLYVLKARMDGHHMSTIARALGITEPTARIHFERALVKMAPHIQPKEPV